MYFIMVLLLGSVATLANGHDLGKECVRYKSKDCRDQIPGGEDEEVRCSIKKCLAYREKEHGHMVYPSKKGEQEYVCVRAEQKLCYFPPLKEREMKEKAVRRLPWPCGGLSGNFDCAPVKGQ